MTTTIDSYIRTIIADKYYYEWYNNPKINKLECVYPQFNDLHIFDKVEDDLTDTREFFTQEQINSIGWEERFEIIRYLTENITHPSNYRADCYIDYRLTEFKAFIYSRQWDIIFDKYALLKICEHCCYEDGVDAMKEFFEKIINDFSIRTAIAKIKRNKIFILGLSIKLSMRDCGIILVN
jgi:hypothetical protein